MQNFNLDLRSLTNPVVQHPLITVTCKLCLVFRVLRQHMRSFRIEFNIVKFLGKLSFRQNQTYFVKLDQVCWNFCWILISCDEAGRSENEAHWLQSRHLGWVPAVLPRESLIRLHKLRAALKAGEIGTNCTKGRGLGEDCWQGCPIHWTEEGVKMENQKKPLLIRPYRIP